MLNNTFGFMAHPMLARLIGMEGGALNWFQWTQTRFPDVT